MKDEQCTGGFRHPVSGNFYQCIKPAGHDMPHRIERPFVPVAKKPVKDMGTDQPAYFEWAMVSEVAP